MRKAITFVIIFNLLFSIVGVAQYAHYCCDTMSEALFTAPSCDCDEMACEEEESEGDGCCKDEVKVVQLLQDGISSEKSEISRPLFVQTLFTVDHNTIGCLFNVSTATSILSDIDRTYSSPPLFILNRLLLI